MIFFNNNRFINMAYFRRKIVAAVRLKLPLTWIPLLQLQTSSFIVPLSLQAPQKGSFLLIFQLLKNCLTFCPSQKRQNCLVTVCVSIGYSQNRKSYTYFVPIFLLSY